MVSKRLSARVINRGLSTVQKDMIFVQLEGTNELFKIESRSNLTINEKVPQVCPKNCRFKISTYTTELERSDILYNLTIFPGPLVCRIRHVPLYQYSTLNPPCVYTNRTRLQAKNHLKFTLRCQ